METFETSKWRGIGLFLKSMLVLMPVCGIVAYAVVHVMGKKFGDMEVGPFHFMLIAMGAGFFVFAIAFFTASGSDRIIVDETGIRAVHDNDRAHIRWENITGLEQRTIKIALMGKLKVCVIKGGEMEIAFARSKAFFNEQLPGYRKPSRPREPDQTAMFVFVEDVEEIKSRIVANANLKPAGPDAWKKERAKPVRYSSEPWWSDEKPAIQSIGAGDFFKVAVMCLFIHGAFVLIAKLSGLPFSSVIEREDGVRLYESCILSFMAGPKIEHYKIFFYIGSLFFPMLAPAVIFPFSRLEQVLIPRVNSFMWITSILLLLLSLAVVYKHPVTSKPWLSVKTNSEGMEIHEKYFGETREPIRFSWNEISCMVKYSREKTEYFGKNGSNAGSWPEIEQKKHPFGKHAVLLADDGAMEIGSGVNGYNRLTDEIVRNADLVRITMNDKQG